MPYEFSAAGRETLQRVKEFMAAHVYVNEARYYDELHGRSSEDGPPVVEELRAVAKQQGLWNLFLPHLKPDEPGTPLSVLDYAPVSEQLGRVEFGSELLNCQAPDTGNMEILHQYGSVAAKEQWLGPLLAGEIRSTFSMTEPAVASSDAANVSLRIERDGSDYVLNGTKWFSSGALNRRCKVLVVLGRSNPDASRHRQHTMIVAPRDTPGISVGRRPRVFGYDHTGGHPELVYENVRVPAENVLGEEGGGFAIAQARLGPGRIHHCMRTLGLAERALELLILRALDRTTFGTRVADRGLIQDWIAEARIEIDMAREYVFRTAHAMDTEGNKSAASLIAGIKVAIPNVALKVIDRAIQVHGAAGVTQFFPLAQWYSLARTIRIADGPDEVHKMSIARREIRRFEARGTEPAT